MRNLFDKLDLDEMGVGAAILVVILIVALVLGLVFGVMCFEAWILMLLWNAIIPVVFVNGTTISFWVAMGIILICNILFKSVHHCSHKND